MRVEMRRHTPPHLLYDLRRQWIEHPIGQRREQRHLIDEPQSGESEAE